MNTNRKLQKGVTPVVATVLLLGITVASVSTVYYTQENILQETQQDLPAEIDSLNIESCWREDSKTHLMVRNTNEERINSSGITLQEESQRIIEDLEISPKVVEPYESFEVIITEGQEIEADQTISIDYKGKSFQDYCGTISQRAENGISEGGGQITGLNTESSLVPRRSNICVGGDCSKSFDNSPTSFDTDDELIDLKGDSVNGTISTEKATTGSTMCLGSGCSTTTGSSEGHLTNETNNLKGTLRLEGLTSSNNLCVGENC